MRVCLVGITGNCAEENVTDWLANKGRLGRRIESIHDVRVVFRLVSAVLCIRGLVEIWIDLKFGE